MLEMKKKAILHWPVNMQITSHFHRTAKRVSQCELNARHVTERKQSIETTHSKLCSHGEEHPTTFYFWSQATASAIE